MKDNILKFFKILTYTDLIAKFLYRTIGVLLKNIFPSLIIEVIYGAILVIDAGFDFLYAELKRRQNKELSKPKMIDYSKVKLAEFKDKADPFGVRKEGAERRKRTIKNLIKRTWYGVKNGQKNNGK